MEAIARTALKHAQAPAGVAEDLRTPSRKLTALALVAAATAMAEAAEPQAELFAASSGLPADFITRLRSAAERVRESVEGRSLRTGRLVGATAGAADDVKRGVAVV